MKKLVRYRQKTEREGEVQTRLQVEPPMEEPKTWENVAYQLDNITLVIQTLSSDV